MPLHPRTLLRRAAKAQLLNKTPALANVRTTNKLSWALEELPALAIYTDSEEIDEASKSTAPRELLRKPQLVFKAVLKETDNIVALHDGALDDALDTFSLMIETAVSADDTLGGIASDVVLARTEMVIDEAGDQLIGAIILTYEAEYTRYAPAESELDNFDLADILYNLGNAVNAEDQAHDVIENLYTL